MSSALKASLTPGSIGFLALSLGLWIILRYGWPRIPRLATAWGALVLGAYLVLSLPVVALAIARWLPPSTPLTLDAKDGTSVSTLIVLDGDNRVARVREAVRIHRAFPAAQVVVLGQRWVMDALVAEGVPRSVILIDNSAGTTRAQIAWIQPRVAPEQAATTAIIASRSQDAPRYRARPRGRAPTPSRTVTYRR